MEIKRINLSELKTLVGKMVTEELKLKRVVIKEDIEGNSVIHKFVMFGYNFPSNFIQEVWKDDQNMINHLKSNFHDAYEKVGANGVMNRFYSNLDGGNRKKLEDWIINNYNG